MTDVIVGGCIPTRSSVSAKYQESVICLNIIIVVLPIELKFIDMSPVVNRRFKREIINGAMKVISGLDWLDARIHSPKKLIDFCLDNKPFLEGCDIVDYVYVLYKCSKINKI